MIGVCNILNLTKTRESKNISRYALAQKSGLRESTLQNIENSCDPNPTFKVMCKIADALEITLDELRRTPNESITSNRK